MKSFFVFFLYLTGSLVSAQSIELISNIPPSENFNLPGDRIAFIELNGKMFFSANTTQTGTELWVSDGTAQGTHILEDIYPGPLDGINFFNQYASISNGLLFFMADDSVHGDELWRTDGTITGTFMVKDIYPGTIGSYPYSFPNFTYKGKLFFSADDPIHGNELWASDGTDSGTYLVKDINPGTGDSYPGNYLGFTVYNNELFFDADDGVHGTELWVTDGTDSGTYMVIDIWPGPESGIGYSPAPSAVPFNNQFIFGADDGIHGTQLWISDGTDSGTHMIKDMYIPSNNWSAFFSPIIYQNKLFFNGSDSVHGYELWISDGTDTGTYMVKDLTPGPYSTNLGLFTPSYNKLFFATTLDNQTYIPWVTDGTTAGTYQLSNISLFPNEATLTFTPCNDQVYFDADDGVNGYQLWISDGTVAGTYMVKDINPIKGSYPAAGISYMNKLYFYASDTGAQYNTWQSNGTDTGTFKIFATDTNYQFTGYDSAIVLNGQLYFFASTPQTGMQLWQLNNSAAAVSDLPMTNNSLQVFPNPADDKVFCIINQLQPNTYLQIFSLDGRLIQSIRVINENTEVDISILSSGLYFLVMQNENSKVVKKFVKE